MKTPNNPPIDAHIDTNQDPQRHHQSNIQWTCSGAWNLHGITPLAIHMAKPIHEQDIQWPQDSVIELNGEGITAMDSAGAWLMHQCEQSLEKHQNTVHYTQFHPHHMETLTLISAEAQKIDEPPPIPKSKGFLYNLGKNACERAKHAFNFLSLTGELWLFCVKGFRHAGIFHPSSICNAIYHTGYRALPILGMLSFLIGVVLAYQMGLQLKTYGANIFIVYLTGVAILREFGPLIAAIIVAGRTSSSFTAEIGMMKVNEEIDALMTMGISPVQRLVLPKTIGLIIAFPLLIFWSDLFGLIGSMVMSKVMLGIGYSDFIVRMKTDVGVSNYFIGLSKAPFFGAIIALVGCYQGFCVSSSADSVGFQTTKSVVQAIFLIIIADAFFSVLYSWAGI